MQLSPRSAVGALSDGTGLGPEEIAFLAVAAVALAGTVIAIRAVDLVMRLWTPSGGRS